MSVRFEVSALRRSIAVTVGWDNPMMTFFAQVEDQTLNDDDDDNYLLLWVGTGHAEITRAEDLIEHLAPYATLTPETVAALRAARAADADHGPTTLQRTFIAPRRTA